MNAFSGLTAINALQRETNRSSRTSSYGGNESSSSKGGKTIGYSETTGTMDRSRTEKSYDKYISHLHLMMKSDLLNSLQYTYFTEFAKIDGSLVNIRYFIDLIDQIEETIESEYQQELVELLMIDSYEEFDILEQFKEYNMSKEIKANIDHIYEVIGEVIGDSVEDALSDADCKMLIGILTSRIKKVNLTNKFKDICAKLFERYLKYDKNSGNFRINKSIRYNMTRVDTIEFTDQQKTSLWRIYDFLVDPNAHTFCFQGYAGTGKTTTIVELVSYLIRNNYIQSVAFTAPTNKAVNVIKNKFRPHLRALVKAMFEKDLESNFCFDDEIGFLELKNVKISFLTIHKLLNFKTDYSVTGDMIFVRDSSSSSLIPDFELVMIDECSMINMDMIDSIFQEIRLVQNMRSKGFKRRAKIMFTGDPAQLPPVNEDRSSIFSKSEEELSFTEYMGIMNFKVTDSIISDAAALMKHKYDQLISDLTSMKSYLLTKVVRSRLDNVTHVCNEFRHLVADDSYGMQQLSENLQKLFLEKNKKQTKEDRLTMHGVGLYQYQEGASRLKTPWFIRFLKSIKRGDTAIILTWTNRQTDQYNEVIRRKIFRNKGKIQKFEESDILMLSEFYSLDLGEDFVTQKLFTSEQIKVVKTNTQEIPLRGFEMINTKSYQKMKNHHKINPELDMLIKYMNDEYCKNKKVLCWLMKVHKLGEDEEKCMAIMVIDDRDKADFKQWKSTSNDMIRNFSNKLLHRYTKGQKQIERLIIKPLWIQWRKIFDEPFANVNYGYSITTHKAQGSSFQDTYVDLNDILQNPREKEAYKCGYTAVTRASNELHVLV
jgi:Mimiviridae putative DNA helicase